MPQRSRPTYHALRPNAEEWHYHLSHDRIRLVAVCHLSPEDTHFSLDMLSEIHEDHLISERHGRFHRDGTSWFRGAQLQLCVPTPGRVEAALAKRLWVLGVEQPPFPEPIVIPQMTCQLALDLFDAGHSSSALQAVAPPPQTEPEPTAPR